MHECFSFRIQILGSRVHAEIIGKSTVVFGETKRKLSSMIEEEEFLQRIFFCPRLGETKVKVYFLVTDTLLLPLKKFFVSPVSDQIYAAAQLSLEDKNSPHPKKGRKFQTRSDKNQGTLPHLQRDIFLNFGEERGQRPCFLWQSIVGRGERYCPSSRHIAIKSRVGRYLNTNSLMLGALSRFEASRKTHDRYA